MVVGSSTQSGNSGRLICFANKKLADTVRSCVNLTKLDTSCLLTRQQFNEIVGPQGLLGWLSYFLAIFITGHLTLEQRMYDNVTKALGSVNGVSPNTKIQIIESSSYGSTPCFLADQAESSELLALLRSTGDPKLHARYAAQADVDDPDMNAYLSTTVGSYFDPDLYLQLAKSKVTKRDTLHNIAKATLACASRIPDNKRESIYSALAANAKVYPKTLALIARNTTDPATLKGVTEHLQTTQFVLAAAAGNPKAQPETLAFIAAMATDPATIKKVTEHLQTTQLVLATAAGNSKAQHKTLAFIAAMATDLATLRIVAQRSDALENRDVRLALINNTATPLDVLAQVIPHITDADTLRAVAQRLGALENQEVRLALINNTATSADVLTQIIPHITETEVFNHLMLVHPWALENPDIRRALINNQTTPLNLLIQAIPHITDGATLHAAVQHPQANPIVHKAVLANKNITLDVFIAVAQNTRDTEVFKAVMKHDLMVKDQDRPDIRTEHEERKALEKRSQAIEARSRAIDARRHTIEALRKQLNTSVQSTQSILDGSQLVPVVRATIERDVEARQQEIECHTLQIKGFDQDTAALAEDKEDLAKRKAALEQAVQQRKIAFNTSLRPVIQAVLENYNCLAVKDRRRFFQSMLAGHVKKFTLSMLAEMAFKARGDESISRAIFGALAMRQGGVQWFLTPRGGLQDNIKRDLEHLLAGSDEDKDTAVMILKNLVHQPDAKAKVLLKDEHVDAMIMQEALKRADAQQGLILLQKARSAGIKGGLSSSSLLHQHRAHFVATA